MTDIDQLRVQPDISRVPGIIICADDKFFRASIVAKDVRCSSVKFKSFRYDHARCLEVEAIVSNCSYRQVPVRNQFVEFSTVALTLHPNTVILHSGGCG